MIRTIRQRIYGLALLPLALLAMTLLVLNGFARVEQARSELRNGQRMVSELLQARAVDALVVGNMLAFDEVTGELLRNSSSIACIVLEDSEERIVSRHGECHAGVSSTDRFAVQTQGEGLSDFDATKEATLGHIAISMNDASVRQKRQQIVIQLAISLLLIALVLGIMQRFLRSRLVVPIEKIHLGMDALRDGAYHTRIPVHGDDELARLSHTINATIERIAAYTRELERRRDEASRALEEADDEGLARDALVRWLTEDLEGPLHAMHGELTAVAIANNDSSLKARIRRVLALLQDARASLTELMQVATAHRVRAAPPISLTDLWLDLQQDIRQYAESSEVRVALTVAGKEMDGDCPMSEFSVDIDSVRLRKALLYLIQSMDRHCLDRTVQVNAQFVPVAEDQLHVVFTLKAMYGPSYDSAADTWIERMSTSAFGRIPPAQLRWTDREARVVDYLMRSIGIAPTFTLSESGSVSIVVEMTRRCTQRSSRSSATVPYEQSHRPVVVGIVTDDSALSRLMERGDLAHVEFRMISFDEALGHLSTLTMHTVLLIDVSDDISDAFTVIHRLLAHEMAPPLIAVCPPGRVSTQLGGQLFDAGFTGIVQKPIQYSRVIEVIEAALGRARRSRSNESQLSR
jgi:methyl-accepting chemotaxis protein